MQQIEQSQVTLNSTVFSREGIKPASEKIQKITEIPFSENMQQHQSFLSMINFMQPFISHLSHHTAPSMTS